MKEIKKTLKAEHELLQDKSKDQGDKLIEVNAVPGEEARPIYINAISY